jgi:hypothetical protein
MKQERFNPSTNVSNWQGRSEYLKGYPGKAMSGALNGGFFAGSTSYDGRYEWIAGYSSVSSSYTFSSIPSGYESYEVRVFYPNQSSQIQACWQLNGATSGYWMNAWSSYNNNKASNSSNNYSENRFTWAAGPSATSGTLSLVDPTQASAKPIGMSLGSSNWYSSYGVVKQLSAMINSAYGDGITSITIKSTNGSNFPSDTTINLFGIKSAV